MGGGEVRAYTISVFAEGLSVNEGVIRCNDMAGIEGIEGRTGPLPPVR